MITERTMQIFAFRQKLGIHCYLTPFLWDDKSKFLTLAPKKYYYPWIAFIVYLSSFAGLSAFLILRRIWNKTVDQQNMLLDAIFMSLCIGISSLGVMIIQNRSSVANWFNHTVRLDVKLTRKYKLQPYYEKKWKFFPIIMDGLMLIIAAMSTFMPFAFIVLFLQGAEPMYRILIEVLDLRVKLQLTHLPIILTVLWIMTECANLVFLFLGVGLTYLATMSFWLKSLTPLNVVDWDVANAKLKEQAKESEAGDGSKKGLLKKAKKRMAAAANSGMRKTPVGFLSDVTGLRIYRSFQVLNRMSNNVLKGIPSTIHWGCCLVLVIMCMFATIRWAGTFPMPAFLIAPLGVILILAIIFFETMLLAGFATSSEVYLSRVKSSCLQTSSLYKEIRSCSKLQLDVGKPFFEIDKGVFLSFWNIAVENLIDVLVSNPPTK